MTEIEEILGKIKQVVNEVVDETLGKISDLDKYSVIELKQSAAGKTYIGSFKMKMLEITETNIDGLLVKYKYLTKEVNEINGNSIEQKKE